MTMTATTPVTEVPPLRRPEAPAVAAEENRRFADLLRDLEPADWTAPTDCPDWDVRAMAAHVLGMTEAFASMREWMHVMRAGGKAAGDGPFIDGMTAVQVRDRAGLSTADLVGRLDAAGPRQARRRGRVPVPLRWLPMKEEVGGEPETWRMGYLLDVILTRDTWMHRVDICRATGREMALSAGHDGRIVADVVAEWARRHGEPCTLTLQGPAGGVFVSGAAGAAAAEITLDAVEFCRILSGRAPGTGLLSQPVPF